MRRDVFLSVGATYTSEQEEFVQGLETLLRDLGLNPRCLGRTEWSDEQPLLAIRRMMEDCHGVVVLAFERTRIEAGREKPGSANETVLSRCSLPTVWNQIEASMAYALDKPLLVLCAKDLRVEGLLEGRYDWYVQRIDMELEATNTREFRGVLEAWKTRLGANATGRRLQALDPGKLSLAELLGALRPGQARIAAAAVFAVVAGISAGSFWLGQHLSLQDDNRGSTEPLETARPARESAGGGRLPALPDRSRSPLDTFGCAARRERSCFDFELDPDGGDDSLSRCRGMLTSYPLSRTPTAPVRPA